MSMEQKLAATAESWLSQAEPSPERMAALKGLIRQRRGARPWIRWTGAASAVAAVLAVVLLWPSVISFAASLPVVGPYIARMARYDTGAYWAEQQGYLVPVGVSASDQGYTLRVEGVVADSARTIIYYTVEGPNLEGQHAPRFDVASGRAHWPRGSSGRHEVVDGKMIGEIHTDPLPSLTATVQLDAEEIAGVAGDWSLSFQASREELGKQAREYAVDQRWQGDGYDLQVTRLLIAPTQTVVELEGTISPEIDLRGAELVIGDQVLRTMGASSQGEGAADGRLKVQYRYFFDRVEVGEAERALFRLTGPVRWQPGGPALELKPGARTEYGGLWYEFLSADQEEVRVVTVWQGDDYLRHRDFEAWTVIEPNREERSGGTGIWPNGDGTATMIVRPDRPVTDPVRLAARKEAMVIPGNFEATIPLK